MNKNNSMLQFHTYLIESDKDSSDTTVGERCKKLKFFLRFHQDPSMTSSKQRVMGERLHLHTTCRSHAEAFERTVMMESYSP